MFNNGFPDGSRHSKPAEDDFLGNQRVAYAAVTAEQKDMLDPMISIGSLGSYPKPTYHDHQPKAPKRVSDSISAASSKRSKMFWRGLNDQFYQGS